MIRGSKSHGATSNEKEATQVSTTAPELAAVAAY